MECEILDQMVKEKIHEAGKNNRVKVSMHFKGGEGMVEGVRETIEKLKNTMDFYLIVNTTEQPSEVR